MTLESLSIEIHIDGDGRTNLSEQDILEIAKPSSASWSEVFEDVLIPESVKGLKILDVGGGSSDATSKLLELGADAYTIDPRYGRMSQLKGDTKFVNNQFKGEIRSMRNRALERFKQSTKTHRERYIDASATSIPFPDNHFDLVFSRIAVLFHLDVDWGIFKNAIDECIRVTKPGGTARLFPFNDTEPLWPIEINETRLRNNQRMLKRLQQDKQINKASVKIVNLDGIDWQLLFIKKS